MCVCCVLEGDQVKRENKHYTRDLKFQLVTERWHNELGVASLLLDMVMWVVLIASEWGSCPSAQGMACSRRLSKLQE